MAVPFVCEYMVSFWQCVHLYGRKFCLYAYMAGKGHVSESDGSHTVSLAAVYGKGRDGRGRMGHVVCDCHVYGVYHKYGYFYGSHTAGAGSRVDGCGKEEGYFDLPDAGLSFAMYFFRPAVSVPEIRGSVREK